MSTPIKPPGSSSGPVGPEGAGESESAEGAEGSFRTLVDEASTPEAAATSEGSAAEAAGPLNALEADLMAGRTSPDAAIEQIVERALESASGLPEEHRAALEAQLREALEGDPTLASLRKDLERATSKA